jgi:hypothetical protein
MFPARRGGSPASSTFSAARCTAPVIGIVAFACCAVWLLLFSLAVRECDVGDGDDRGAAGIGSAKSRGGAPAGGLGRPVGLFLASAARLPRRAYQTVANALGGRAGGAGGAGGAEQVLLDKARRLLALHDERRAAAAAAAAAGGNALADTAAHDEGMDGVQDLALALAAALIDAELANAEEEGSSARDEASSKGGVRGAAPAAAAAAAPAAAPPAPAAAPAATTPSRQAGFDPSDPYAHHTRQTCYVQLDESEVCVYDGVFCFDGRSPIALVDEPVREPERINDFTHSCMDPRFYEPGSLEDGGCAYMTSGERKSFNWTRPRNPPTDTPLSLRLRRWGPLNRNGLLFFKELLPEEVLGAQPDHAFLGLDDVPSAQRLRAPPAPEDPRGPLTTDTLVVRDGPFELDGAPGLRVRRRTYTRNMTVDWLDGALWVAGIDGQWFSNPYHWFTKIGALFDTMRANVSKGGFGSHPMDSYPNWASAGAFGNKRTTVLASEVAAANGGAYIAGDATSSDGPKGAPDGGLLGVDNPHNRISWRQGAQWDIPPMDFVLFAGDGAYPLVNKSDLNEWFRATLELAIQPATRTYFNDALSRLSPNHIVCSTRGVIPGAKNKFFTGRSDAWLYRQYAYMMAGLPEKGIKSHPLYPPRKITVIDRKGMNGRGIYNRDELIAAVEATGLPYELVGNMAKLSFAQQVELMAGTGILIAPHGAHLANAMFLPAHAVVVEMYPVRCC